MKRPVLALLCALTFPAVAAQAQGMSCTPEFTLTAAREKTRSAAEAALDREVSALMAKRYGPGNAYTLSAGVAARRAAFSCARDGGGLVCTAKGRICVAKQRAPDCAGTLSVDAMGAGDRCLTSRGSGANVSAGISTPTCATGYVLAENKGPDYCRLR
ncbi:MAG: hypothetical protein ACK4GO_18055 [Gemmobacter sp.]